MAMFHVVKNQSNEVIWVNFDMIRTMKRMGNYTRIAFDDGEYIDTEATPEDILAMLPDTHQSKY